MNRSTIDLWVGVFVAAGFAALLFLALKVGNLATFSTEPDLPGQAKFDNIGGLKVRGAGEERRAWSSGASPTSSFDNESYEARGHA